MKKLRLRNPFYFKKEPTYEINNDPIYDVVKSAICKFAFAESEKLGIQVNELNINIDPRYDDDGFVELVIADDSFNELVSYKIKTVLN